MADEIATAQPKMIGDRSTMTEPESFDMIDFIRSEKLKDMEDEGMSCLLFLLDVVEDLAGTNTAPTKLDGEEDSTPRKQTIAHICHCQAAETVMKDRHLQKRLPQPSHLLQPETL